MVNKLPNLNPEAQPWGREITDEVNGLSRLVSNSKQDNFNNNSQLSSQVDLLAAQQRLGAANTYTKAQIDDKDAQRAPVNHNHVQSQITGVWDKGVNTGADIATTGNSYLNGPLFSTNARGYNLPADYVVMYIGPDGRIGRTPSSLRYKQDFKPVPTTDLIKGIYTAALVCFKYIEAVETLGIDNAPWEVGGIAEYFEETGLKPYVYYDKQGLPDGINYERLTIPLILAVQDLNNRVRIIEAENTALKARLASAETRLAAMDTRLKKIEQTLIAINM